MKTLLLIMLALSSFFNSYAGDSNEKWIVRISTGQPIEDLVLNPSPEIQKDEKTGKPIYMIKGIFYRESWDLMCEGKRVVTDPSGVFYLRIPIKAETTTVELIAKGPGNKIQSEKLGIVIPKEEQERVLKDVEVAEKKEERQEEKKEAVIEEVPAITEVPVDPAASAPFEFTKGPKFKAVYVAPLVALQNGAIQKNYSVTIGWSPAFYFSPKFGARLSVGAMAFDKSGGGRFVSTDAVLFGEWRFIKRLSLSGGPGFQYWWGFGGFNAEAVGELSYYFDKPLFKTIKIDRVFGGFAWLFDTLKTKQVRVGVALSF